MFFNVAYHHVQIYIIVLRQWSFSVYMALGVFEYFVLVICSNAFIPVSWQCLTLVLGKWTDLLDCDSPFPKEHIFLAEAIVSSQVT